ncbi:Gfo/Idh/MocA family protein [Aporhodopirellula aestuarii]|uniref:Gfo/Idh/MocA family oxidoreductase n=1 Tax=Aporhodopirellula aestuarii TaxID=2950107 RepID=A0ABT0U7R6_9BACT|nr:Gfo/Idh/MocA family oxidoreductase [Aporhodopirellula aestuarii]MCM2372987.1 gfo/Idh/MocA family oxidoreductase [Aporhodopirellula aestuarii]
MKLRVGLIGLGDHWQTMHRPALRMLSERFDVRAIYCSVAKLAENAVTDFQADPVDGYQTMVARDDIDAVLILEQTWLKHLPALAACSQGKAIYWASGLDFDPVEDAEFKRCVEDSGIAFMASFPRRFAPATLRLKELIATNLGAPRLLFCHKRLSLLEQQTRLSRRGDSVRRSGGEKSRDDTRPTNSHGHVDAQATMRNELIELIDWCNYVVGGKPESVMSANCSPDTEWDYRALSLRFSPPSNTPIQLRKAAAKQWETRSPHSFPQYSAPTPAEPAIPVATAQISCGNYIPAKWQEAIGFRPPAGMQVCCEHGVAFIDLPGTLVWFDDAGRHQESLESESPVGEKILGQFHRAVTSLVRNLSGLEDAFRAATILKAAELSSESGHRIEL